MNQKLINSLAILVDAVWSNLEYRGIDTNRVEVEENLTKAFLDLDQGIENALANAVEFYMGESK